MTRTHFLGAAAAAAMALFATSAQAADPVLPDDSGWQFTVAPYIWAAGIEGKSGLFGLPEQDVDVTFIDTLKHLNMVFSGVTEMRKGAISISTDLLYARLGANIDKPKGLLANDIDATAATFMATGLVGYSAYMSDRATVDLVAGARLWSSETEFDFNGGALDGTTASDGDTWVDPVAGVKFKFGLSDSFYLAGWGLVGGFGVGSDIMWDVMGGIGYNINEYSTVFAGYRAMHDEYENGGFKSEITQSGPIIGGTFSF
jgi:hypothetical protein